MRIRHKCKCSYVSLLIIKQLIAEVPDKETGLGKGTVGKPVDPPGSLLVRFPNPFATGSEAGNLTRSLPS